MSSVVLPESFDIRISYTYGSEFKQSFQSFVMQRYLCLKVFDIIMVLYHCSFGQQMLSHATVIQTILVQCIAIIEQFGSICNSNCLKFDIFIF